MPVCLAKAASTSSSAFFIDAAAKIRIDWSCDFCCACAEHGNTANANAASTAITLVPFDTTALQCEWRARTRAVTQLLIRIAAGLREPSFRAVIRRAPGAPLAATDDSAAGRTGQATRPLQAIGLFPPWRTLLCCRQAFGSAQCRKAGRS